MVLLGTQWGWRCRCVYEHSFHLFHLLGLHSLGKQAEVVWVSQNKSNAGFGVVVRFIINRL